MILIVKVMATLFVVTTGAFVLLLMSPLFQSKAPTLSTLEPLRLSISYEQNQRIYPEIQPLGTMDFAW